MGSAATVESQVWGWVMGLGTGEDKVNVTYLGRQTLAFEEIFGVVGQVRAGGFGVNGYA